MTLRAARGTLVADVMVRFPKTHNPASRLEEIRALFENDHVHMALIVALDRRLVTTIERPDLAAALPGATPAAELGTLTGRTARQTDPIDASTAVLLRHRRRRLAVVDESGRLVGLLCLKKDDTGYCSDEGIRQRSSQAGAQGRRLASSVPPQYPERPDDELAVLEVAVLGCVDHVHSGSARSMLVSKARPVAFRTDLRQAHTLGFHVRAQAGG